MCAPRIMIVEDERIVAADIQQMLETFGFSVIGVENSGEGAISKAEILKPDIILMDIMLKGKMNGIDAAFGIGKEQDIPIIYVTAFADNESFKKALRTNPYGYLLKPFCKKELHRVVETAFCKHKRIISEQKAEVVYDGRTATETFLDEIPESKAEVEKNGYTEKSGCTDKPIPHESPFSNILLKYNKDLFTLTEELKRENVSQLTINLLIKVSYELAVFKIKRNINRIQNINKRWQLSVEDIAIDSISTLFVNNKKRNVLNLKLSLQNWNEPIRNSFDALYFLNKSVSLSVEQCINKIFRECDPTFAKVLDTFTKAARNYNYNRVDYFGTVYLTHGDVSSIAGKIIERDAFLNIPVDLKMPKKQMIQYLLNYLEEQTDYFPAVPLNLLVERIIGIGLDTNKHLKPQTSSYFSELCLEDIIQIAFRKVEMKLKEGYLNTGKINSVEYDTLMAALSDIKEDFIGGNTIWSVYEYFKRNAGLIPKDQYKMKYQNILEYMVKMFKQIIARELRT